MADAFQMPSTANSDMNILKSFGKFLSQNNHDIVGATNDITATGMNGEVSSIGSPNLMNTPAEFDNKNTNSDFHVSKEKTSALDDRKKVRNIVISHENTGQDNANMLYRKDSNTDRTQLSNKITQSHEVIPDQFKRSRYSGYELTSKDSLMFDDANDGNVSHEEDGLVHKVSAEDEVLMALINSCKCILYKSILISLFEMSIYCRSSNSFSISIMHIYSFHHKDGWKQTTSN